MKTDFYHSWQHKFICCPLGIRLLHCLRCTVSALACTFGHGTNLGAGRVVYQELTRINQAVRNHTLQDNAAFQQVMDECLQPSIEKYFLV